MAANNKKETTDRIKQFGTLDSDLHQFRSFVDCLWRYVNIPGHPAVCLATRRGEPGEPVAPGAPIGPLIPFQPRGPVEPGEPVQTMRLLYVVNLKVGHLPYSIGRQRNNNCYTTISSRTTISRYVYVKM